MIKVGESYQLKNGSTVIVKKLIKDYESKREFALTIIDNEEYVDLCQEYGHRKKRILPRFAC
ncbi:hypothetical protein MUA26_08855 [Staphylococcus sp. IVB6246]|uniref:hypothetical protein n=1 Tax=Staphylococcus sp. IVB6246 TaxID=2989772 RepID=UPI0021CF1D0D|nr:hypothetical protein [Staphylococcus sp. IVB6246]UXR69223.1 hypothetical protein MUA26_08855 [Staphylococcus sp. IVB6246]